MKKNKYKAIYLILEIILQMKNLKLSQKNMGSKNF